MKEAIMLKVTNTLTGNKEIFKSLEPNKIKMYVCGITPYDDAHVGHGRVSVIFDAFYRLFKFLGFDITYCRNFTDIDDKLINRAEKEFGDKLRYKEIADKYIKMYTEDVDNLNCLKPDVEPRVTENIPEIIEFIEKLIALGNAYVANGDVYFSIKTFPSYGKLAKHNLDDLRAGSRVEVSDIKKDPLDFVLWKSAEEGTFWKSPWGYGRPGWHIECSVLGNKFLGKQLDIHGGGMDLIFPHHENEIAQSETHNKKTFVNYWIHNAFVRIDKEKMSKSLGNFFTLRQVFEKFDPIIVRFYILKHHYRAPLDFSYEELENTQKSYKKLVNIFHGVSCPKVTREDVTKSKLASKMLDFLCDDLNVPGMLGVLFENLSEIKDNKEELCLVKALLTDILGLTLEPIAEKQVEITPEIQKLIDERVAARAAKDWAKADEIRDKLVSMGVEVQDKKTK
ncbi:cysteine--tRNA ligase [Candidatus Dependentiae bacterium]